MALRVLYTACVRKYNQPTLSPASNATSMPYISQGHTMAQEVEYGSRGHSNSDFNYDEKKSPISIAVEAAEHQTDNDNDTEILAGTTAVAVLPQHTYRHSVDLTIREDGLPHLQGSFSVFRGTEQVFKVERERPSATRRQNIFDARTGALALTVRTQIAQLPVSYRFEDPAGATVLDLQGNFFVPFTGAKSTAALLDRTTGEKVTLAMKGSYRNRHAEILNEVTGETLVTMTSRVLEARNLVGGRRTYEVHVEAGFDISIAVGMILALDSRAG